MNARAPAGKHERIGGVHDCRTQELPNGIQVVGCAGHDVAGAGALVVGVREAFEMLKKIVAEIELNVTRNADHDPTSQKLENSLRTSHQQNQRRIKFQLIDGDAGIEAFTAARITCGRRIQIPLLKRTQIAPSTRPVRYFLR